MANRFIGGVLSSRPQANTPFSSRASTGTYFDSAGVMRTAPINQPRLNYILVGSAWTQPSVLIEPESTNFLTYSEDLSNGVWSSNNSITTNQAVAPDGATTADLVYPASTGSFQVRYQQNPTGTSTKITGYTFTVSIFAKAAGKSWLFLGDDNSTTRGIWFNVSTGVIGTRGSGMLNGRIEFVGNGWYRCQVTYITNGVVRLLTAITDADNSSSVTASGTNGIHLWGAQLEERFTATSYIPTTTAGVTRAADVVGPYSTGIFNLSDRQNTTAVDDQSTVTSFTSTGSYSWTAPADVTSVEVLVVAGGGGGAYYIGGGGGAGGLLYNTQYAVVPGNTYPVVVGAGGLGVGSASPTSINNGRNSQFGNLIAIGGGQGGSGDPPGGPGGNHGGSGGGQGRRGDGRGGVIGQGVPGQGFSGGAGAATGGSDGVGTGGGGGGAGGPGLPANTSAVPGNGGPGLYFTISGTSTAYAGGGGGGAYSGSNSVGGVGGGGAGSGTAAGTAGTANTGGGGGSAGYPSPGAGGGAGGSGIVVIKYKRTLKQISSTSNAAIVTQRFTTSNLWTVPTGVTQVEALVVAGGGAGGYDRGGGGGAGGLSYSSALTVTPGSTYTIGVGAGGIGGTAYRNNNGQSQSGFGSGIGTGTELITNGNSFTTTTGWSATTATLSVPQTGTFRILPNASVNGSASQTITTVIGTTYVVVVKVTSDASKFFRLFVGTSQFGQQNATFFTAYTRDSLDNGVSGAGFYSVTFTASATTTWIDLQIGGGTQQATDISYISVRQATLPTIGGGYGGDGAGAAASGGSGGGTGSGAVSSGGAGTAGQGNSGGANGGSTNNGGAGGGGGAGSSGSNGGYGTGTGGSGGAGLPYSITGNLEYYAGGGGGGAAQDFVAPKISGFGGVGGGGQGGNASADPGKAGAPNTGGGGGGGSNIAQGAGGNGGSGVVILRYRVPQVAVFQDSGAWTCPSGVTSVQALIVAGGGGGGYCLSGDGGGGGGGAGGLIYSSRVAVTPGATYAVVVGQGGAPAVSQTVNGSIGANSNFANLIATGGGGGGSTRATGSAVLNSGGSGGGAGSDSGGDTGGAGTYGQGNAGGNCTTGGNGGGGGGAGNNGVSVSLNSDVPNGGAGLAYSISGTSTTYAGGGGGGKYGAGTGDAGAGGAGGGGSGGKGFTGTPGLINTGGGGGGGGMSPTSSFTGSAGGSGIVIIRWIGG